MKKFISLSLSILLVVSVMPMGVFGMPVNATTSEFAGGSGTETDPYLIETKYHLDNVRNHLDAHYKMIADIVFTEADFAEGGDFYNNGQGWEPIGTNINSPFSGYFDGNYKTIYGLSISIDDDYYTGSIYAGLFGCNSGNISDLNIKYCTTSAIFYYGSDSTSPFVGSVAGHNSGIIKNCHTENVSITTTTRLNSDEIVEIYTGGISGYNTNIIEQCSVSGKVTGKSLENNPVYHYTGGITGCNSGNIKFCKNEATVSTDIDSIHTTAYTGGIVAFNVIGNIENCCNMGEIKSEAIIPSSTRSVHAVAGGIVASNSVSTDQIAIKNCFNNGYISAYSNAASYTDISSSTGSAASSYSSASAGGIIGSDGANTIIENCYNTSGVRASAYSYGAYASAKSCSGGILGDSSTYSSKYSLGYIRNCYNIGNNISSNASATKSSVACKGGIAGASSFRPINNCFYSNKIISKGIGTGTDNTTGCSEEELKQLDTYTGFDFESVWEFAEDNCYRYPTLIGVGSFVPHTFDNTCDTECNICKETRTITHTYDSTSDSVCNICGKKRILKVNVIVDTNISVGKSIPSSVTATFEVEPLGAQNDNLGRLYDWYYSYDGVTFIKCANNSKFEVGKYYALYPYAGDNYGTDKDTVWYLNGKPLIQSSVIWNEIDDYITVDYIICPSKVSGNNLIVTHTYSGDCDDECNVCHDTRVSGENHTYSGDSDTKCDICGNVRTVFTEKYYKWDVVNGEARITLVDEAIAGDVVIPSTLGGYSVTNIGEEAFFDCNLLTSVTIPECITSISRGAFSNCESLTSITIPNSVTSIGPSAFSNCTGLSSITIPYSVTSIGDEAFYWCYSLESISIPESITSIGSSTFFCCENLTSVTLPNSITNIDDFAFSNCSSLTSIILPNSVTSIGQYAFECCGELTSMAIPEGITSIEKFAFYNCIALEDIWYSGSEENKAKINIGGSNEYLLNANWHYNTCKEEHSYSGDCDTSCNNCDWTRIVNLSHSYDGDSDTKCNVCGDIRTVSAETYYSYSVSKGNATITDVKTSISGDIIIPSTLGGCPVTNIGDGAFYECTRITSITFPDSVTSIGEYAFSSCTGLTNITIPEGITIIGLNAFLGCSGITTVNFNATNCTSKGSTASGFFSYCDNLKTINIGDNVTNIPDQAFFLCSKVESITIPNSVISIGNAAFYRCTELTNVTIGNGIIHFGNSAFAYCTSLTSINIPYSVTGIGVDVFGGCSSLTDVWYGGNEDHRESIAMGGDDVLFYATWHYNYCADSNTKVHIFNNSCDKTCNICEYTRTITHTYENNCDAECNICGSVRVPFDHVYDNTCDAECNVCHEIRSITHTYDGNCDNECNLCHDTRVSGVNHTYDNTCDTECNICYETRAITHTYDGVCDNECNICHDTRVSGVNHAYDTSCDTECNVCHEVRTITHTYDSACDRECNVCFTTRTTSVAHMYDNVCDTDCNLCHETRSITHTYDGDCDSECNVCYTPRTSTTGHTYSNENDLICNVCSEQRATGGHIYDNNNDMICNGCGYDRSVPSTVTSSKYTVSGKNISKITAGTTVKELLNNLGEGEYCKVYQGNTEVSSTTKIGTGMKVKIMDGNTVKAEYTIIVTGDTNGDGNISVTDMISIKAHLLGNSILSNEYAKAADTSGDNTITITDFLQIKAKILGVGTITAR